MKQASGLGTPRNGVVPEQAETENLNILCSAECSGLFCAKPMGWPVVGTSGTGAPEHVPIAR
jgi:hypothetical protein